jgi:hypothetical protein
LGREFVLVVLETGGSTTGVAFAPAVGRVSWKNAPKDPIRKPVKACEHTVSKELKKLGLTRGGCGSTSGGGRQGVLTATTVVDASVAAVAGGELIPTLPTVGVDATVEVSVAAAADAAWLSTVAEAVVVVLDGNQY